MFEFIILVYVTTDLRCVFINIKLNKFFNDKLSLIK
jgi:hypothetical protein